MCDYGGEPVVEHRLELRSHRAAAGGSCQAGVLRGWGWPGGGRPAEVVVNEEEEEEGG